MKSVALFMYTDDRFNHLADLSINSFKKWHPEIDIEIRNKHNIDFQKILDYGMSYCRLEYASQLFDQGYNKVIILGVDTITTQRLSEFIDNNEDILTTLDFKYSLNLNEIRISENAHYNADVVCFNNKNAILEILQTMKTCTSDFLDQGAMNQILSVENTIYTHKNVDSEESNVVYNARIYSLNNSHHHHDAIIGKYPYPFRQENDKLITHTNKVIKVIHMLLGLWECDLQTSVDRINRVKNQMFNEETKSYIINKCGISEDWFKNEMIINEIDINSIPTRFSKGDKLNFDKLFNMNNYLTEKFKK